jgi:hypothetical protein
LPAVDIFFVGEDTSFGGIIEPLDRKPQFPFPALTGTNIPMQISRDFFPGF